MGAELVHSNWRVRLRSSLQSTDDRHRQVLDRQAKATLLHGKEFTTQIKGDNSIFVRVQLHCVGVHYRHVIIFNLFAPHHLTAALQSHHARQHDL